MRLGRIALSPGGIWVPMAAAGGLALPFTTGLSTLLIPDGRHTVLDGSGVIRVRATVGSDSQEQSDPTHQFGWAATSALGGRAVLTRPVSTPYLLTAAGAALAHPFVIYAVIGPPTSAPASLIFDGNASGSRAFLANISASQYQMGGASGSITGTHTVPSSGSLFTCIYDGASSELRANGVSLGTGTTSTAAIDHAVWGARFSFSNPSGALMALFAIQTGHPTGPQIEANEAAIMEWFSL